MDEIKNYIHYARRVISIMNDTKNRNGFPETDIPLLKATMMYPKIFNIDDNVSRLLMPDRTKNKVGLRKMAFPNMFISNNLKINDNEIWGLSLYDGFITENNQKKREIFIHFLLIKYIKRTNFGSELFKVPLITFNEATCWADFSKEDHKIIKDIRLYVVNFLDFLNNPEIKVTVIKRTKEQNQKRIKRGKIPIPPINYVRVTGKLKIYLDKLNSGAHFSYSHKFWVRGHFRTLRSDKWVNKRGTKMWILPFIKGQGVLVNKIYEVKK